MLDNWEKEIDFSGLATTTLTIGSLHDTETRVCEWSEGPPHLIANTIDILNAGSTNDEFLESLRAVILLNVLIQCSDLLDGGSGAWTLLSASYTAAFFTTSGQIIGNAHITVSVVREYAPGTCTPDATPPDADPTWILLTDNCPTDCLWVKKAVGVVYNGAIGTVETPLHLAYPLRSIIDYLLTAQCGTPVLSNFFNINPDATAPDNEAYQKAAIGLTDVHVIHFSDFIKDDEDGPDTHSEIPIALKSVLTSLPGNIDIAIDAGTLRIEHVSYFDRLLMLDLTHADHVKHITGKVQYKYDKEKLPKEEEFLWKGLTDGKGKDFDGLPILYEGACTDPDKKKKTFRADLFYSNVKYLYEHKADYIDNLDGLLIISVTDNKVLSDVCPISGLLKLNGHFAWSTLQQNYYKWDRPQSTGIMNGQPTTFFRWMRQKEQVPLKCYLCCDDLDTFNPNDLVKTQLGWGEVADATLDEPVGVLTINTIHH